MEGKVEKALCICNHCGPHWPFVIPAWYLSDKKWRFGFKRYEKVPVWHIVPYRPTSSPGVCGRQRVCISILIGSCMFMILKCHSYTL